jgi:hypothetical protein
MLKGDWWPLREVPFRRSKDREFAVGAEVAQFQKVPRKYVNDRNG